MAEKIFLENAFCKLPERFNQTRNRLRPQPPIVSQTPPTELVSAFTASLW